MIDREILTDRKVDRQKDNDNDNDNDNDSDSDKQTDRLTDTQVDRQIDICRYSRARRHTHTHWTGFKSLQLSMVSIGQCAGLKETCNCQ